MIVLFYLIAGHFLCDFPLQGDTMAREKSRHSLTDLQREVPWFYWMTAHAFIHGCAVAIVTGSVTLGLFEAFWHWLIDFLKGEALIGIHIDQIGHILCKAVWFGLFLTGAI